MPSTITVEFETASGDTQNATQALGGLRWETGRVTLRRRAPHTFEFVIPRAAGVHRVADFVPGREMRIKRDGVYWLAGFMGAPSLPGGSAGGAIALPCWGNAYALMLARGAPLLDVIGGEYQGFDVDGLITELLNNTEHGSGGDWFPLAGRTLYASALTVNKFWMTGKTALEYLNELCDLDGVAWRVGISAAGAFTISVGTTVEQDRSASVTLYDGANCRIVDWRQDGSRIASQVLVASKRAPVDTRTAAAPGVGVTTFNLDSNAGLFDGDVVTIGVGVAAQENRTISTINGSQQITLSAGLGNAHALDEVVKAAAPGSHRTTLRTAAASVAQAHHEQQETVYDDTLGNSVERQERGDTLLAVYDHPLRTATVETTDARLIDILLANGVEPGDDVSLTTADPDLDDYYAGGAVTVQELSYDLADGAVVKATLTLGDPRADDLAAVERQIAAGRQYAVSSM